MNTNIVFLKSKEHYKWLFLFCEETIDRLKKQDSIIINDSILESLSYALFRELKNDASFVLDDELTKEVCTKNNIIKELLFLVDKEEIEKTSLDLLNKLVIKGKKYFDDRYPLFREMLERDCDIFVENVITIYKRILENKANIEDKILGSKFNEIVDIKFGLGDLHNNHQSTTIIYFDNGKIIYHPRDCRVDNWYENIIKSSFSDITYSPKTLCIDGTYGFSEYIESNPAQNESDAKKYFYNFGGLCAILKTLGSNDVHYENILTKDGIYPILIDLEMTIGGEREYPFGTPKHSFNHDLKDTLITKCILPSYDRDANYQFSPLLNTSEDNKSLPIINGKKVDVYPYEDFFIKGFTDVYNRCIELKESLLLSLEQLNNINIRWIIRPTQIYYDIKKTLFMPEAFKSIEKRNAYFIMIKERYLSTINGLLSNVITSELEALINGDIPYFYFRANSKDIFVGDEMVINNFLIKNPIEHTKDVILSLNQEELQFELDIIHHSLDSAVILDKNSKVDQSIVSDYDISEEKITSLMETIYKEVRNDSLLSNNNTLGWLLPDYSGNLQMENIFLESGISGLALFFASLAATSLNPSIKNEASDLCDKCLKKIDIYLNDYIEKEALSSSILGLGMIKGMAGVIYSIYKCNVLLNTNDNQLLFKAIDATNKIMIEEIDDLSYESGLLGIAYVINCLKEIDYSGILNLKNRIRKKLMRMNHKSSSNIELLSSLKLMNIECDDIASEKNDVDKKSLINRIKTYCLTRNWQELDKIIDLDIFYGDTLELGNTMCVDLLLTIGNSKKAIYILNNMIHRKSINGLYLFSKKCEKLTTNSSLMFGISGIGYELLRLTNREIKGIYFGELINN